MATPVANMLRGALFFSWFLPSFSNLGYQFRRQVWSNRAPDFSAQTWVVTGASTGIGREIALSAVRAGAAVVAVARSADKLAALAREAKDLPGTMEPCPQDLSDMGTVKGLADKLAKEVGSMDVLVNNVGVMFGRAETTDEDLDAAFATNLLGHYVLTEQLIAKDALAKGAAVINMSSGGMYNVPLELATLQGGSPYDGTIAYAYHKRAQVALNAHWRSRYGDRLNSYVMHPGWVDTPGVETAMPEFHAGLRALLRKPPAGADTAIWLADRRPAQARPEGIWFDRGLRPAHVLPGTRSGVKTSELVDYLEAQAKQAQANRHASS